MGSDSQDSHRKHHRSPSSDESPEKSKRHKHRHHRHHHRRHRHHRSKHEEEEIKKVVEVAEVAKLVDYDDMEEGEIVEDGELIPVAAPVAAMSDVESGELDDDSYYNMRGDAIAGNTGTDHSDESGDVKNHGSYSRHDKSSVVVSESIVNGDSKNRSRKGESRSHRSKSPLIGSRKEKDKHRSQIEQWDVELMEVDEDEHEYKRNSYSRNGRDDRHKAVYRSPSRGRYNLETSDRRMSESPGRRKDRDRSQSIVHERRSRSRHHHESEEGINENGKVDEELDGKMDSRVGGDYYRLDDREQARDKRRERSSSRHRSGKREDGGSWEREKEEKIYRDDKRVADEEPIRGRYGRGNDRDKDWEADQDRRRRDHDRDQEKVRETKRDIDQDREHRGRSRDRAMEGERRRDASISSYRARDAEREWDRLRDRERKLDMDRGRDKYRGRDRYDEQTDRRYHNYDNRDNGYGRDRRHGYDEEEYRRDRNMKHESENDRAKDDSLKKMEDAAKREEEDQKDYQERVELQLAEQEKDDLVKIKEESRRRTEAILQKYKVKPPQKQVAPQADRESDKEQKEHSSEMSSTGVVLEERNGTKNDFEEASAVEKLFDVGKSPSRDEATAGEKSNGAGGLGEGSPKSERSNDMFCDDIFGDSPAGVRKTGKGDGLPVERSGLHDNWDDAEGYYSFRFGEILDSRYEVAAAHGKGVFSTVVRAKDLKAGSSDPEEVAIKIIRNNETMLKAGTEELVILKKLVGSDPDDRRHCVRYLSHFKYRNHLCIVFESLHMNLREVLKKFGRNIGLSLTAVRTYSKQLFIALKHLRNCGVLHCDIKPDNMLVNDAKNVLKLCDFGNAMFAGKNEITPYLVSRFYRAPEIILGLPYDHPMDIWSVGCCLYELYTGKVLFPGATNNDMLRLHMELKGPFPKKMLRKGAFIEQHFDQDLNFLAMEEDPVTKKAIRRLILNIKPKDIGTIIKGSPGEDPKMLSNFKDLLDKIFVLDPDKRLTVSQALNHPFITGK